MSVCTTHGGAQRLEGVYTYTRGGVLIKARGHAVPMVIGTGFLGNACLFSVSPIRQHPAD